MKQAQWARDYYNRWESYEEDTAADGWDVPDELAKAVIPHLAGHHIVLDVGCGTGRVGAELRRRGFTGKLIGLDAAEERLAEAKTRTVAGNPAYDLVRTGDAYRLPWTVPSFEAVVSAAMLGLTGPRSLVQMLRVLREGGLLGVVIGRVPEYAVFARRYETVMRTMRTFIGSGLLRVEREAELGSGYRRRDDGRHDMFVCRLTRPYRTRR